MQKAVIAPTHADQITQHETALGQTYADAWQKRPTPAHHEEKSRAYHLDCHIPQHRGYDHHQYQYDALHKALLEGEGDHNSRMNALMAFCLGHKWQIADIRHTFFEVIPNFSESSGF